MEHKKVLWKMHSMAGQDMLQRRTAHHGTAHHGPAHCGTAQHSMAQHGTAQHSTAQHSTARHSTGQHSMARHSTARHGMAQHSTAQHTPDGGLVIHGCHRQQEVGDVSNVHPQLDVAAGKLPHMQCVIYVFAAGWIDAADGQMPQVFPAVSAWRYQNIHTKEGAMQPQRCYGWADASSSPLQSVLVIGYSQQGKDEAVKAWMGGLMCAQGVMDHCRGGRVCNID